MFHKFCGPHVETLWCLGEHLMICTVRGCLPQRRKAGTGTKTAEMPNWQLISILTLVFTSAGSGMVRVKDYWPEVADDLTLISWSHATNSKALLEQALADSTMMIEADVSLGAENVPIMAHPPANTSDLTLQQFLESVLVSTESGKKKGIKLDFKFLEVVEPSLRQLDGLRDKLKMPLWLNADILQGPGGGGQSSLTTTLILAMRFQALFVCLSGVEPDPCSLYFLARTTFVLVILARGQKSL